MSALFKTKKLIIYIVFCTLLVLVSAGDVFAADDEIKTVKVGYYENEVFQEGAEEGAIKRGYAYEYYRKISEYTGWKYEYVYGEYGDLYQSLLDGDIDLLAGLAWKEERDGLIGYPDQPMGSETYNLVKHSTSEDITTDLSTLSGRTIGVLDSAMVDVLNGFLNKNHITADVRTYTDYTALFADFDAGGLDLLAAEGDGAYGRDNAEVLTPFGKSEYYLCVNIKRADILSELNVAQATLAAEEPYYLYSLNTKFYPVSFSAKAFSASEKEWLNTHDTLRVGYLENYMPYSGTDKNGGVTGIIGDIIPEMLTDLGLFKLKSEYTGYESYDTMLKELSEGKIDVAFPVGGGLYFSEESGVYQSAPVASASTELVYKGSFSKDTTKRFAVNENNRMQFYFVKTNYPDAEITLYPSIDACLEAVAAGRENCTTLNGLRANDMLKNRKYKELALYQLVRNDDRCFGVEIGNEGLLRLLNRGISIVGSDYAQNISYRYVDALYSYSLIDVISDHIVLFGCLAGAIGAVIIFLLIRDVRRTRKQMAEKEIARTELEEKNTELEKSREELRRQQDALKDALAAAEHANNAKTVFLNNMSHDIRTPMNAIVGFTALAASHIDNKAQVKDYLGKISVSSGHLLSLINDVLDMSRIESGKMTIEEAEVHLPDMIHDLRTIINANVSAKQLELFIDTRDVVHEDIITDKLRLNQVLLNILSNAIKFTPSGGTVSFRVIEKKTHAENMTGFEFRIKDSGIGMSEEFQKTIFDAFTREQSSTVSGIQGTGLGMAISKNIVDMMGGTITVSSKENEGSEFVVDIPCKISGDPVKVEPISELNGLRALVADDDTDTCLSICAMLREIGMRPDWTNYGKEAVIRAKEAEDSADGFKAYIIDWMMPDMNGIETVRRIRKVTGNSAPIIILTAYDTTDIEEEAREAGVTAFCSKPIFMSELRNVMAKPFCDTDRKPDNEPKVDFGGKRVLLAEDNELNRMIAEAILKDAGLVVEIAENGKIAVEKMKNAPAGSYDIVLMDIQMPVMDGYEAAKQIRKLDDAQKANIPIVAVTANAFEEDKKTAMEAGMNGHLAKPYDIPQIMETLEILLNDPSARTL